MLGLISKMIIVSEEEDDSDSSPLIFLRQPVNESVLNVNHDYRYLRMGYYVSAHAETYGVEATPYFNLSALGLLRWNGILAWKNQ
jgi:hypothetical protein